MWKKNIIYDVEIEAITGLHIGGLNDQLRIGGVDSSVIKTYMTYRDSSEGRWTVEVPYIPGSSIKGKIRSLLLTAYGERVIKSKGNAEDVEFSDDALKHMFGVPSKNTSEGSSQKIDRTRLITRDAFPKIEEVEELLRENSLYEIKGENKINLFTGKAENPRFIERIRPGVKFYGNFILQIMDNDDEDLMDRYLKEGIEMLNDSYLGGNGSRGYGKVKVTITSKKEKTLEDYKIIEENQEDE